MPVATDIKYYRSLLDSYVAAANGGRIGTQEVIDNVAHGIHPVPTRSEMSAGVSRMKKVFIHNQNSSDEAARNAKRYMDMISNATDYYLIADALDDATNGWRGTESQIVAADVLWMGAGQLQTAIVATDTQIILTMENAAASFKSGGTVHIADYFSVSQTIAAGVTVGDSVQWSAGAAEWQLIALDADIVYPKGRYMGDDIVMTDIAGTSNECFLEIEDYVYTDVGIGDGTGATNTPTLDALTNIPIVFDLPAHRPVISTEISSVAKTITVGADGVCTGDCSAGELNLTTGAWTVNPVWDGNPDSGTDNITITYRKRPYTYSGAVCTLQLAEQVPYAFATANTYGSGCLEKTSIAAAVEDWVETVAGDGTYDESTYPMEVFNLGTVDDDFTLTMTSGSAFSFALASVGALAAGDINTDYEPINPDTGVAYLKLQQEGFADTWATNDTITGTLRPAQWPAWNKQVIPAGISVTPENQQSDQLYFE